jgi:transaldolase
MELFVDTALIEEIHEAQKLGIVDGVTTNPSLMAQTGKNQKEVIAEIASIIYGPISAEVNSTHYEGMVEEGRELANIHSNVVIKLPMTEDGIRACKFFTQNSIKTNVTLAFSSNQALLAAKAGATYVSPFIGRLDDIGHDGMKLIEEIRHLFDNYGFPTKILAASIRSPFHVREACLVGADVATCPLKVIKALYQHPLTTSGLNTFLSDFKKSQK